MASQLFQKLLKVQIELKAPKKQFNSYGKYKYRSCEDILVAVKPLLERENLILTLTDRVEFKAGETITKLPLMLGDERDPSTQTLAYREDKTSGRYYIIATATIIDTETGESISAEGWAREPEEKKGSTADQVSGSTSSYARKIALNGLLLTDDAKDSDTTNVGDRSKAQDNEELIKVQDDIIKLCVKLGGSTNTELMNTIKEYVKNGNPKAIKSIDKATELYNKLKTMKA